MLFSLILFKPFNPQVRNITPKIIPIININKAVNGDKSETTSERVVKGNEPIEIQLEIQILCLKFVLYPNTILVKNKINILNNK